MATLNIPNEVSFTHSYVRRLITTFPILIKQGENILTISTNKHGRGRNHTTDQFILDP